MFNPRDYHPDAIAKVQPLLDAISGRPLLAAQLGMALLPLASGSDPIPSLHHEQQGQYASWPSGTMDFVIDPLPIDDGVHTVSKILALWDIPTRAQAQDAGMPHASLAWTGNGEELMDFLVGFVIIGGGDTDHWTAERLEPLRDYILSLNPPTPPAQDPVAVERGREVFAEAGCITCNGGLQGSGVRVFGLDEVGTDPAMARWGDPDAAGELCCGLDPMDRANATFGIKAPRLVGLWAMSRFGHNGAINSLEELLCLVERPASLPEPLGNQGHAFGCDLEDAAREDLLAYLRSH